MSMYELTGWTDLFVAVAGAAAALAGLVFVAVSINIAAILKMRGVPEGALNTVLLLLGAVVVSIFGLVPESLDAFAVEVLVVGSLLLGWCVYNSRSAWTEARGHPGWLVSRVGIVVPGSAAYVIAGASLLARSGGGLAWVLGGIVGALVGAVINAWVLLVEILR